MASKSFSFLRIDDNCRRCSIRQIRRFFPNNRPMCPLTMTSPSPPTRRRPGPDPRGRRVPRSVCTAASTPAGASCWRPGPSARPASTPASAPTSCAETADDPRRATGRSPEAPKALADRRVEITGPVERKMMINALNSGAKVFMADFEDANSPTWDNVVDRPGQPAGRGARHDRARHRRRRPTGWPRRPPPSWSGPAAGTWPRSTSWSTASRSRPACSTSGCTCSTTAGRALDRGASARTSTCRSWRAISRPGCGTTSCSAAEDALGLDRGTIRATVLIETITAAFEMDEILYELREHICGLNAGRWDYIFSVAKRFHDRPGVRAARPRRW